jgi:hypothetical protein
MEPILNDKNIDLFWKYIIERYNIFLKKNKGDNYPWTYDPILLEWKFTNVFRDTDPGTLYLINEIIPRFNDDFNNLLFNVIIYRIYNKIETSEYIGMQNLNDFDADNIEKKLREIVNNNNKVFTNAFIVPSYRFICKDKDKIGRSCVLLEKIKNNLSQTCQKILNGQNSESTYKEILKLPGIGKFLSYQICVDLGYWNTELFDENKFVIAGPGCVNGLNRLFLDKKKLSDEDCIQYLVDIQKLGFEKNNIELKTFFKDRKEPYLNLMAMENCLCEISKYLKIYYKEGRARNKYKFIE